MTKLAPEWVRTSDPVIRSPARYRWTMAPASTNSVSDPENIEPTNFVFVGGSSGAVSQGGGVVPDHDSQRKKTPFHI